MNSVDIITPTPSPAIAAPEIVWTPDPSVRLEKIPRDHGDLLDLAPSALVAYAVDLRCEAGTLRLFLHEALGLVSRQTMQMARLQARVRDLLEALRSARDEGRNLRARQRRLDDVVA